MTKSVKRTGMKSAACLSINRPGAMTPKGRDDIVAWLRRQATNLKRHGPMYTDTGAFRAVYHYA